MQGIQFLCSLILGLLSRLLFPLTSLFYSCKRVQLSLSFSTQRFKLQCIRLWQTRWLSLTLWADLTSTWNGMFTLIFQFKLNFSLITPTESFRIMMELNPIVLSRRNTWSSMARSKETLFTFTAFSQTQLSSAEVRTTRLATYTMNT